MCFHTSYQSKTKKRVRYQYEIRSQSSKSLNHSTDSEYDNFPKKSSSKNRKNLIKNNHLSKSQPTSLNVLPPHMQAAMRYNMYNPETAYYHYYNYGVPYGAFNNFSQGPRSSHFVIDTRDSVVHQQVLTYGTPKLAPAASFENFPVAGTSIERSNRREMVCCSIQ